MIQTFFIITIHSCVDGQKIAKRLSSQILKETKRIKTLLLNYSVCPSKVELSIKEALDPSVLSIKFDHRSKSKTMAVKQDLLQARLLIQRSQEEIDMLHCEMRNTLAFFQRKKDTIEAEIMKLKSFSTDFARGSIALLQHLKLKVMKAIEDCTCRFAIGTVCDVSDPKALDNESDSSDTESESDCYDSEFEDD